MGGRQKTTLFMGLEKGRGEEESRESSKEKKQAKGKK